MFMMYSKLQYDSDSLLSRGAINLFILVFGVCMALMMQCYTPVGDDIVYSTAMNHYAERYGAAGWPAYCVGHWISTNGRMANFLAPFFISILPRWLTDICVGLTYAWLIVLMLRSVEFGERAFFSKSLLIGLVVFTLPWYDDLLLYDCWLNYVVAIVLTLWWLKLWERENHSVLLLIVIGFIAAMMHESCSLAVSAGMLVKLVTEKHDSRSYKRKLAAAATYWLGCALCLSSPGMISRMADNPLADNRLEVLYTSNFYVVILVIAIVVLLLAPEGRKTLWSLLKSNWSIYAAAALTGCIISVFSGIAGRSGFFAQIFAMIALFVMAKRLEIRIPRIPAAVIGSVILIVSAIQIFYTLHIQSCIAQESKEVIELIENSTEGVVYHDMTVSNNPPAFTLGKCVSLPKRTDVWLYSVWKHSIAPDRQLVILPDSFSRMDFSTGKATASTGKCEILPLVDVCLKDTILRAQGESHVLMDANRLATPVRLSGHDYVVLDRM